MRRLFFFCGCRDHLDLPSFPTRRSSDLYQKLRGRQGQRRDVSLDEVLPLFDERGRHVGPTADWSARVDDPSIQTELRLALTAAIDELPAGSRTMLVLRDVEGLSNGGLAEGLGLSVPVVKTRVHRARMFLRKLA